jgi:hypothetical protein
VTAALYRRRAVFGALLACAITLPLLSGCSLYQRVFHRGGKYFVGCTERPFAGNADSRPALKVPDGMSAPDTRNAVKIPALSTPDKYTGKTEPCLAQPPNFFAQPLPLEQSGKAKKSRKPENPPAPATGPAPAAPAAPAPDATPAPAATPAPDTTPAPAVPPASTVPTSPAPAAPSPSPGPSTVTPPQDTGPG